MKVLSISTDRNIFKKESSVRARMIEYGALFEELHIVIFSNKNTSYQKEQISSNTWIYPTNSWLKFSYIRDAAKTASKIISERKLDPTKDVLTVQDPFEAGLVGIKLKKLFEFKLHVQIHTDFLSPYFSRDSILNRIRVRISQKVLPQADAVRVVSERIKRSLSNDPQNTHSAFKHLLKVEPHVLPIFVDITKLTESKDSDLLKQRYSRYNFTLLMASRLTAEKNIPLALHALKEIVAKYPRVGLIIVGEGKEKNNLVSRVKDLGLKDNVVFEDWQKDLVEYYKSANLFLLTSNYEGYGLTIVEAVGAHCPVVSTDVGIAPDVLDPATVCPVADVRCFTDKVMNLIENNNLREEYIHTALANLSKVAIESKTEYLSQYKKSIESAL